MRNDDLQLRKRDDVGLIDGFLRLLNPDLYEKYRETGSCSLEYTPLTLVSIEFVVYDY